MTTRVYGDQEARLQTEPELFETLCLCFGHPNRRQKLGLADAAALIAQGKLPWSQVEQAIDERWDPGFVNIYEHFNTSL